ncbi:hypothetical protein D3C76_1768970 [compost metagenome]
MPKALRAMAGSACARVVEAITGFVGALTEAWATSLTSCALRSVATLALRPPSSFASRKAPLLFKAWASALPSPS